MTSSLVGSEMCIRDRFPFEELLSVTGSMAYQGGGHVANQTSRTSRRPVSYTHLTLPTICSV
eukprot:5607512-Prorocentrum_lima.AAC.1